MAERLGDVVVRAEIESPDAVSFFPARGQQDDRHWSTFTQFATDLEAAQPGQHNVEHDEIRQRSFGEREGFFATVRQDRPVPLFAQRVANDVGDVAVIVDDENVHSSSLARGSSTPKRGPRGTLSSPSPVPPWMPTLGC